MHTTQHLAQQIFRLRTPADFEAAALAVFRYQAAHNAVYARFLAYNNCLPHLVQHLPQIPFLPISLFKTQQIVCGTAAAQAVFSSSGTTGTNTSRHYVQDLSLYEQSFMAAFEQFYGQVSDYAVLALLPSYLERNGSSLVYMAQHLIAQSGDADSGFYLHNYADLSRLLYRRNSKQQKTLLLGVSFALWDLAEQYPQALPHTIVMETGGMKGKRPEIVRPQLHHILSEAFGCGSIHSEYGMTEMLSQAYSAGGGVFACPPWLRVLTREATDPRHLLPVGDTGCLNVIDLANLHSCSFLATDDVGKCYPNGMFEVLGRTDNSQVRGCNLLLE